MPPTTRNSNATSAPSTTKGNNVSKSKNKKATGKKPANHPANSIEDNPAHNPVLYKQFLDSLKKKGKGASKAAANETNKRHRELEDQSL